MPSTSQIQERNMFFFSFWKVGCDLLRGSLRVVGVMSHAHPLGDYVDCNPS